MKKCIAFSLAMTWLFQSCAFAVDQKGDGFTVTPPAANDTTAQSSIQVALILDTSGSMDGLIEQAKTKLWKIVNELATARKNGQLPNVQIALYHYGNDGIPQKEHYVKMLVPLSNDLDKISDELFKLTTNGGSEFCGYAIKHATEELAWSTSNSDLKMIFIAGNEPFNQGDYNYETACRNAIAKGIVVNTIHCGSSNEGISTYWKHGAELADGQYLFIDQNASAITMATPYDTTLQRLNMSLNGTYMAYTSEGKTKRKAMEVQDKNAANMSTGTVAERAVSKSSKVYKSEWDLVSNYAENEAMLDSVKADDLPEELKNKTKPEREAYLKDLSKKRNQVQTEIQEVNKKRMGFLATNQSKEQQSLDGAMINAVQTQASRKGFTLQKP